MTTNVVHFSVTGEAMTSLFRDFWVEGRHHFAITGLLEGLHGMTEEIAIAIVTGQMKLTGVDELGLEEDNESTHSGIPLSLDYAWTKAVKDYLQYFADVSMLQRRLVFLTRQASSAGSNYRRNSDYSEFSQRTDYKSYQRKKELLAECADAIGFIGKLVGKSFKDVPIDTAPIYPSGISEEYGNTYNPIEQGAILDDQEYPNDTSPFTVELPSSDMVQKFIEDSIRLDKESEKGIEPVNIEDGYDAGWLAPDGTYYGLNGEIANMLHNRIADSLVEAGIIPNTHDEGENPDNWLLKHGWIRQHGNWILYDGYIIAQLGKKEIPISEEQKEALRKFAYKCHKGILSLGYKRINVTGTMLMMIDPLQFRNKFFSL